MSLIDDWIKNSKLVYIYKVDSLQSIALDSYLNCTTKANDKIISSFILRRFGDVRVKTMPTLGAASEAETELKRVLNFDLSEKKEYLYYEVVKEKTIVYFWHSLLNKKYNSFIDYCREFNINIANFYNELITYHTTLCNQVLAEI